MNYNIPLLKLDADKVYENSSGQQVKINNKGAFFLKDVNGWTEVDPINSKYRVFNNGLSETSLKYLLAQVNEADAFKKPRAEALLLNQIVDDIENLKETVFKSSNTTDLNND